MGSVIRMERKQITLNEWTWALQVLAQFNTGQFVPVRDVKYRGAIWTSDKEIRGYVERGDIGFVWHVRIEGSKQTKATGGGSLEMALADMLAAMTRERTKLTVWKNRKVEDQQSLCCNTATEKSLTV